MRRRSWHLLIKTAAIMATLTLLVPASGCVDCIVEGVASGLGTSISTVVETTMTQALGNLTTRD